MKFWPTYVVLFAITQTYTNAARFAVSPLDGFEQFYLQTKNSRSFEKRSDEEASDVKSDICEAIIGSSLFRTRHHCRAALDVEAVDNELKQNYTRFYQKTRGSNNPYKMMPMSINGRIAQERVFFCLARLNGSAISLYHVSPPYNVDQRQPRIMNGRFIFEDDKVIALAEEPASVQQQDRRVIEEGFWNNFYVAYQTKWLSDDRLCQLSALEKIRLCNCVLNSIEYQNSIVYSPEEKNIEPQCQLREISFEFEHIAEKDKSANAYKGTSVTEWMIPCKAKRTGTHESIMRYVLRGSKASNEFVYYVGMGSEENATYLESIVGNKIKKKVVEDENANAGKQDNAQQERGRQSEVKREESDDDDQEEEGGGFFQSGFGGGGHFSSGGGGAGQAYEIFL